MDTKLCTLNVLVSFFLLLFCKIVVLLGAGSVINGAAPSSFYTFNWSSFPLGFLLIFFLFLQSFLWFCLVLVSLGLVQCKGIWFLVVESSSVFLDSLFSSLSPVLVGQSSPSMGQSGSFVWN